MTFVNALIETLKKTPVWFFMAHQEIVSKYRRTTLGPWWITLGTGIGLGAMGFVWSSVFNINIDEFFPYLVSGFIFWTFISSTLIESPEIFIRASSTLKSVKLPLLIFVFTTILKNLYVLFHNIIIFVISAFIFHLKLSAVTLLFIPGLVLLIVNALLGGISLAIIGSRLRDLSHIISSLMTFLFLLTPIMWNPNILGGKKVFLAYLNPITHYLSIVREPLLNRIPDSISYLSVAGLTVLLFSLAAFLYRRFEKRVIFWV